MNKELKITPENKLAWWGEGPWVHEPDELKFTHLGYECFVRRMVAEELNRSIFGGHLCGYVCISENHPFFENRDDIDVQIHGGITFAEKDLEGKYWIGFDCAHSYDLMPSMKDWKIKMKNDFVKKFPDLPSFQFNFTYRTFDWVVEETKNLAAQCAVVGKENER